MTDQPTPSTPSRTLQLVAAFAAVYLIWGSTYLAIRLLMETLPGFTMVGLRFFVAGGLLIAWAVFRGAQRPSRRQIVTAGWIGIMLLCVGTGAVVWATQYLDSGLVALLVAMEPLWLAMLIMVLPGMGLRPTAGTWAALALGFGGAVLLAAPTDVLGSEAIHLPSVLVLAVGCLSWAAGSLLSRRVSLPKSMSMSSGIQMLVGGAALIVVGFGYGEWSAIDPAGVSNRSILAFLYLVVFGSIIAFSAYAWLILQVNPTLVSTHTYVNPVVAIYLGWLIAGESVGPRTLAAAALILTSVVIMTSIEARQNRKRRRVEAERSRLSDSSAAQHLSGRHDHQNRGDENDSHNCSLPAQAIGQLEPQR